MNCLTLVLRLMAAVLRSALGTSILTSRLNCLYVMSEEWPLITLFFCTQLQFSLQWLSASSFRKHVGVSGLVLR